VGGAAQHLKTWLARSVTRGRGRSAGGKAAAGAGGGALAALLAASLAGTPVTAATARAGPRPGAAHEAPAAQGFGSEWTVYHGNSLGTGVDTSGTNLSPLRSAWVSPVLDGQLYGEPLVYAGRVFAATEHDTVYELAADTGRVIWSRHVGTAVPQSDLPCGDIAPEVGITGTPVVDPTRHEIFVVADELSGGSNVSHQLVGINIYNGNIELDQALNPPGSTPTALLQRAGLALDDGQVVVGFGGNYGDCGTYHGTVAAVPAAGGTSRYYVVDSAPGEREGAVWMGGGAPLVDSSGNIWVAVGNGSQSGSPYDYSDSVTELSADLSREQYFAPAGWGYQNAHDQDLGSTAPAFVDGFVVQVGKAHEAYLLGAGHLGGIGGQVAAVPLCGSSDPDGGLAVSGTTVYVPCGEGVTALQVSRSAPYLRVLWTTGKTPSGVSINGPPIVAGGLVWSLDAYGTLWGLNPSTGSHVATQQTNAGEPDHFPTPAVADGLLLVPTTDQVFAYDGPAGLPPPPPPVPGQTRYWVASAAGNVYAFGGAQDHGSVGHPLAKPIVGMAPAPGGTGYWLVASDGGIFAFGSARYHGSMGGRHLNRPIVGMAATEDGRGYWLVASDGGIFAFGDARFRGSMGGRRLNRPIVGMAADPHGTGYWLVASDGGIFAFHAPFLGSTGRIHLNSPIVGMAADPRAAGYWLVAADGGVFGFQAPYEGSLGSSPAPAPVVGVAPTTDGYGYWMVDRGGGVYGFGTALPDGGPPASAVPIAAIAAVS
jgi:ribosomal protein L24E